MKTFKSIFIFFLIVGMLQKAYSQNEYYDATAIAKTLDINRHFGQKQFTVLHKYFPGKTDPQIATELAGNPFLKSYFDPASLAAVPSDFLKNSTILSSVGNLNVTNFADGIAQFLIERGKEEIDVAFFQRMQNFLTQHAEIMVVFPSTSSFINNIQSYNYS